MLNQELLEKKFIKYTELFDIKNDKIKRKQEHSLRVRDISKDIAQKINLSNEEIEIATLIGLLHDIGRFQQFTQYRTFKDEESVDHGNLGVEILKKDNYIKEYIDKEKYMDTIYLAIKNHNKYKIEENLTENQEMYCKIIRDADKIDIYYEASKIFYNYSEIKEINKLVINENIINRIYQKHVINKKELKINNRGKNIITILAFIFDINYKESLEIIFNNKYIDKILERFNFEDEYTKEKMKEIQNFLNEYIEEKIKG